MPDYEPTDDPNPTGERLMPFLLGRLRRASVAPGSPCLDAEELAAFVEGSASPQIRDRFLAHVAHCHACRVEIAALQLPSAQAPQVVLRRSTRATSRRQRALRLAATVIAGLGLVAATWFVMWRPGIESTGRRVQALWSRLEARVPELLQGIAAFTHAELLTRRHDLRDAGELVLLHPQDVIASDAPTFEWLPVAGAAAYVVELRDLDGAVLFERSRPAGSDDQRGPLVLPYPEDANRPAEGGSYSWSVACQSAYGSQRAHKQFRVAMSEARSLAPIDALASEMNQREREVLPLVRSWLSLRYGLLADAERQARAFVAAHPHDVLGRATLFQVLERIGSPAADQIYAELQDGGEER